MHAQVNTDDKITAEAGNALLLSNVNLTFDAYVPGEQVIIMQIQVASFGSNAAIWAEKNCRNAQYFAISFGKIN